MHNAKWFFSGIMLLISMVVFSQQLKLGKNPYLLNKSAVLELESANQGLLFTRIADTALINVQTPPDGMVIFHIPSLQLLLRTSGSWKPLTVSSALSNYWSTSGNTATTATNFLGTTDLRHLYFKTNNVQALFIDSAGNAGIGTSPLFTIGNREKFLVDAGITTSFNVISGKGSIDNYLQLNIQNRSAGASASSDVVASADNATESINYVDLGINSSAFTNATYPVLSGLNNAYLYSTGNDFIIGNATAGRNVRFFSGGYANANERMRIDGNGNVGMGVLSPTAYLHIKAGTATAATAPLKFTSGTLLTTTEDGSVEYNGSHFFGTIGTTRYQLDQQTGIISLNGLTTSVQTFATAIAGTTPAWSSVSPTHTLNIPLASTGTTTAGLISNNSFTSFTNKVGAITMPATTLHAALTFTVPAGGAATGVLLLNTQAANKIFAGPVTGVDVVPVFRALVPADLPVATATTTGAISAGSGLLVNGAGVLSTNFSLGSLSATAPLAYNNTTGVISIPKATTAVDGYLSFADWNTFNNKLSSIDTSNIAGFYTKVRSELSGGTGISYITNTGVISNTGVLSLNGLTGPLTMDTGFIGNFSTKVRSLFSTTAPVTYSNGLIGITQANTTTNGYLSSTDWNTFNSKAASYSSGNLTETGSAVLTITGGTNAVLGSGTTVLVKQAGGAQNGFLTSADWTAFNNKLSTVDTTNITSFALKVRSLFSATAPITYSNGLIGITQATSSTNGYLNSVDWNSFNSKVNSINLGGNVVDAATTFSVSSGVATGIMTLNTQIRNTIFSGPASGIDAMPTFRILLPADLPVATTTTLGGISVGAGLSVTAGGLLSATNTNSGTVTTVSATGTQGVTASVLNPTTTPALTIGLGAITPTSVAATGTVSGSNLSGINTGNQTIALTGDVSGTGTGSFVTTIAPNVVSYAKIQPVTATRLLGNPTVSTANASEIILGTGFSFTGSTLNFTPPTSGTVTSVGLVLPSIFTVSGTPVTSSGTLSGVLNTQTANLIFAGPASGIAATPTFRTLAPADVPIATTLLVGGISVGSGLSVSVAGVLSTNFSLGSLSATAPLAYNNTTGVISIPKATTAVDGYLSFADWNTFNNKLSSIDTSNIAGFYTKVRSELSGGTGISYITNTGVISNTGVLSLNGLTGPLTMDTGFIGNFSTKVRSLFSTTAPVTYSNGLIGITQANTTTNGYLSSTDWNTFNSKAASYSSGNLTETGSAVLTITGGTNAVLGSGTTVLVKQAGGAQNGFLTSADWTAFNNKLSTVDTTNITSFALKVRSLFSATAPITYSNGLIGINQATTFANGYLSSTDFNTFNNKAGSISLTGTPLFSPTNFTVTAGSATGSLVLNSQSANQIFAGPPSGVAAAPGFRLLTTADLPAGTGTTSNTWTTTGNSGITSGTNFIGTTDIKSFVMRTNNSQGLILDSLGNVGVGFSPLFTASPNREKLLVDAGINAANDYINVVSGKGNTNNYLQVNIQNRSGGTAASSDIVATNNLGSESSNYIDMGINSSGFATGTISGAPNTAYLFATGNDFVIGNSTSGKPLRFYTTASGISANAVLVDSAGKVGIGILTPAEKLDVTGNLKLTGAFMPGGNAGTSGYFLTSNGAGTSPSWSSLSSSQQWALNGNTVTTEKSLGTLSNFDLPFITNSTEKMRISASGNVGIGSAAFDATNPEKLLVDAGTTNSSTLINATGSKNGYLQLNVQNISNGNFASTDIVATANNGTDNSVYIDMGINSQGYTTGNSNLLNGSNTAYLYASAGDFYVGNGATNKPLIFFTNTGIQGDAYANGTENMRIQPGGNVGIGTSAPSQKLTVNGNIGASAYVTNSDKRLKTNIQNLSYGLKEVLALQPVKYNWRKTPNGDKQIGLIAQDVRKVIPEVVVGDATKEKLGLNYTELVPVLINAIKEQQKQIDDLKQQILKLQK